MAFPGAEEFVPRTRSLTALAEAAAGCAGCDLHERATQVVFGRGAPEASVILVGEQPGDVEDVRGEPFVGPAGRLLDRALDESGLARTSVYTTNAVKHFRWKPARSGKRRIHEKPTQAQVTACRPWLAAELAAVAPRVVVALGATAAASLLGPSFRLTQHRGEVLDWPPPSGRFVDDGTPIEHVVATIHPSAVLRAPDGERDEMFRGLAADLELVAGLV